LKKKPRFFCDNCGCEVDYTAKSCPGCGRFFDSVRCPKCGFSGTEKNFAHGCPSCGYSAPPGKGARGKKAHSGSLPGWVYIFSVLALLVMLALLGYVITR